MKINNKVGSGKKNCECEHLGSVLNKMSIFSTGRTINLISCCVWFFEITPKHSVRFSLSLSSGCDTDVPSKLTISYIIHHIARMRLWIFTGPDKNQQSLWKLPFCRMHMLTFKVSDRQKGFN